MVGPSCAQASIRLGGLAKAGFQHSLNRPERRYLIPKQTGLRLDLERYLRYYNTERAHTGRWTRGRTPEEVLGKVKMWSR